MTAIRPLALPLVGACLSFSAHAQIPFAEFSSPTLTVELRSLQAADIDRDGDCDLALIDSGGAISWLENRLPVGSDWTSRSVALAGYGGTRLELEDLTKDAHVDMLGYDARGLVLLRSLDHDGTGWVEQPLEVVAASGGVAVSGDVDGDGDRDLMVAGDGQATAFLRDAVAGQAWVAASLGPASGSIVDARILDLDHDGRRDVLLLSTSELAWLSNAGIGPQWPTTRIAALATSAPLALEVADLDRDGHADAVVTFTDAIRWWRNPGAAAGAWIETMIAPASPDPAGACPADLDGDGDLDIALADGAAGAIVWLENADGAGTAWVRHTPPLPAVRGRLAAADFDRDGDIDLAGVRRVGTGTVIVENRANHRGARLLQAHKIDEVTGAGAFDWVLGADIDRDGDGDVIAVRSGGGLFWWENIAGDGSAWTRRTIAATGSSCPTELADVDSDGDLDIIGRTSLSYAFTWWENADRATRWVTRTGPAHSFFFSNYAARDFDGDGDIDIAGSIQIMDNIWWENRDGRGTQWSGHTYKPKGGGPNPDLAAADFDRDGRIDITMNKGGDSVVWYRNIAAVPWPDNLIRNDLPIPDSPWMRIADFDRNGLPDVIMSTSWTGQQSFRWWRNEEKGSKWSSYEPFNRHDIFNVADLDRDGDSDVFGRYRWWENEDPLAAKWPERTAPPGAAWSDTVDVDRDGDLDFVGCAYNSANGTYYPSIWWGENAAGHLNAVTTPTLKSQYYEGQLLELLVTEVAHFGRAGDPDVMLESMALRLTDEAGIPLTAERSARGFARAEAFLERRDAGESRWLESGVITLERPVVDAEGKLIFPLDQPAGRGRLAHGDRLRISILVTMAMEGVSDRMKFRASLEPSAWRARDAEVAGPLQCAGAVVSTPLITPELSVGAPWVDSIE